MKKSASTFALLLMFISAIGQNAEMADQMRSSGKIYVVVGVIVLIFAVLFSYLLYMDFRLKKIEKEVDEK
jgi:cytochrome c biogenesis factor